MTLLRRLIPTAAKRLAGIAFVTAGVLCAAGPAWGAAYGPLTAWDNGRRVAQGAGTVYHSTSNGDRLGVHYRVVDVRDNSHAVYTQAKWYFNGTYCYPSGAGSIGCGSGWYGSGKSESLRTSRYRTGYLFKGFRGTAQSIRAGVQVCEDQGTWNPDACSGTAYRGVSY